MSEMFCLNPQCAEDKFDVEELPAGYGRLFRIVDARGIQRHVAADEPACPSCGWVLFRPGESPGAEFLQEAPGNGA